MADVERELAIRLAWYIDRYGYLGEEDLMRLALIANGSAKNEEAERIRAMVQDILEHVRGA